MHLIRVDFPLKTNFKRITHGIFLPSLVPIGIVVVEKKIIKCEKFTGNDGHTMMIIHKINCRYINV
jgi:hypothetical protein